MICDKVAHWIGEATQNHLVVPLGHKRVTHCYVDDGIGLWALIAKSKQPGLESRLVRNLDSPIWTSSTLVLKANYQPLEWLWNGVLVNVHSVSLPFNLQDTLCWLALCSVSELFFFIDPEYSELWHGLTKTRPHNLINVAILIQIKCIIIEWIISFFQEESRVSEQQQIAGATTTGEKDK